MEKFSNILGEHEFAGDNLNENLLFFKNEKFFEDFYNRNLDITRQDMKNSVNWDVLLIQSVNSAEEINKTANLLSKRLREWYELYNPEISRRIGDHEKFIEEVTVKEKNDILKDLGIGINESLGASLKESDLEPIKNLGIAIKDLYKLKKKQMVYLSSLMEGACPNIKIVCGALIGAKLIEHAGSLKKLSGMPASKIQILGAEKSLFRHMKTGSKPPRHGVIAEHPLIANAPEKLHGKIARTLADKICIAAKVDYFHGNFIGENLKKGLEVKFGKTF